jgi:hypothetical protein
MERLVSAAIALVLLVTIVVGIIADLATGWLTRGGGR